MVIVYIALAVAALFIAGLAIAAAMASNRATRLEEEARKEASPPGAAQEKPRGF